MSTLAYAGAAIAFFTVLVGYAALRQNLRDERSRSRSLEAQLRDRMAAPPVAAPPRQAARATASPTVRVPSIAQPEPPPELVQTLAAKETVLFAGAELAVGPGVPTYRDLLRLAIEASSETLADAAPSLQRQLRTGEEEIVVELLRSRLGDEGLTEVLVELLGDASGQRASGTMATLLGLPFAGFVTDDWSGHVGAQVAPPTAIRLTPWGDADYDAILRGRRPFVLEAYGSAQAGAMLFDARDLRAARDRNRNHERFLAWLLGTRSLLFVGVTLKHVRELVDVGEGAVRTGDRMHWALVPWQPDIELLAELFASRYGVQLLPYDPARRDETVDAFMRQLRIRLSQYLLSRGMLSGIGSTHGAEELSSLRLENIGPFEELSLVLGNRRTILLGDNGSGKSSILRAVAVALAGETPERTAIAQRMLRSGAEAGSIELTIGNDTYRTELRRERNRVHADSLAYTPVNAGLWLALGFPPLRGVSLRDPAGPESVADLAPGPEDLAPLLLPTPDGRMDSLKQWIVNTDVRARGGFEDSRRHADMLDHFFVIARDLLPGVDFEFKGVNPRTWQVLLESSEDGEITFDLLSQGMVAVLGWIGVLLQRMYEVHGESQEATARSAVVLIDEIDAHLHPGWQRAILPLLRRHFPAVRLLATTHSPLVVTSVEDDDAIIRLERDDGQLRAERLERHFRGATPDQVLTSAAFDLETPLDEVTDRLLREYTTLLAQGETPNDNERVAELATALGEPRVSRTPQEEEAARLFRAWLFEQLADVSPEQRCPSPVRGSATWIACSQRTTGDSRRLRARSHDAAAERVAAQMGAACETRVRPRLRRRRGWQAAGHGRSR